MKQFTLLCCALLLMAACDKKKASYKGTVKDQNTGAAVPQLLVTVHQSKTGDNTSTDIIVGQCYTNKNGEFLIDHTVGSKSMKKWLTVYEGSKKLAEKDDLGLNESGLVIEVIP
ncbi:MAG: hypothetical protein JST26_11110 [Bacteroidetes bacterium]|nr:hypothetical protein [Bacteroidota bacterium]